MKRSSPAILALLLFLSFMDFSDIAFAGPGCVVIKTEGDITATFGAQARFIPTYEKDWDFGIQSKTGITGTFLLHLNEAGVVNKSYIRTEPPLL